MDILQLKYFYEVALSLHVTNTANKLHVAQPSLTQTIHRLEQELGVKLFKTKGRNIALTEYGEFLKQEIGPVIRITDDLPGKMAELAEKNKNSITVNVLAASGPVVGEILKFRETHTDVRIRIVQNTESDSADVTVFTEPQYRGDPDAEDVFVFHEGIFLAVPDGGDFAGVTQIPLAQVRDRDFISLAGSKQLRRICDRFCDQAGFAPNIIFESDSPQTVRDMIAMNLGVGFWPQYTWGDCGGSVRLLPVTQPACARDIIVRRDLKAHRGNDETVQAFFDGLTARFRSFAE